MVPDVLTCNSPISTCAKRKQPGRAQQLLEAMQRQAVAPIAITYSSPISTCEKDKQNNNQSGPTQQGTYYYKPNNKGLVLQG